MDNNNYNIGDRIEVYYFPLLPYINSYSFENDKRKFYSYLGGIIIIISLIIDLIIRVIRDGIFYKPKSKYLKPEM